MDNLVIDTGAYVGPIGQKADLREREAAAAASLNRLSLESAKRLEATTSPATSGSRRQPDPRP